MRNCSAYLGGKNVGRWKGGGEQSYKKESANNSPTNQKKSQKKPKKIENKEKKHQKKGK